MNKIVFLFFSILIFSIACHAQKPYLIDLEKAIRDVSKINCSSFIEKLDYVSLQTNENSLINKFPSVDIVDSLIIIQTVKSCFLFDSFSGSFIKSIGRHGRGPGEFRSTLQLIDSDSKAIFFNGWNNNILSYDFSDKLLYDVKIPLQNSSFNKPSFPTEFTIFRNRVICYFTNIDGKEEKLLMSFTKRYGDSIQIIRNTNVFSDKPISFSTKEAQLYCLNNKLFFKENYNDTLFEVVDKQLVPHAIFHTGKFHFSYEQKWMQRQYFNEFIIPQKIFESRKFISFQFHFKEKSYFGLFNKINYSLNLLENPKGYINDIDGFIDFIPLNRSTDNKLIALVEAYKIVQWFKDNPEKAANLPEHLKKFKNIKETDNPIIMIAKLKD